MSSRNGNMRRIINHYAAFHFSLFFVYSSFFSFFSFLLYIFFSVFWVAFINGLNEISAWNKLSVMKRKKVKDDMFQDWLNGKVQKWNYLLIYQILFFFPLFLFFWKKFYHEEFKNSLKGKTFFYSIFLHMHC